MLIFYESVQSTPTKFLLACCLQVTAKASSAANGGLANPLNSYINFQILESPTSVPDGAPAPSDTTKVKRTPSMQRDDTDIQRIQHRAEKLGYKVSTV